MKHLRKYIRQILLAESAAAGRLFTNELESRFEARQGGALAVSFPDGCEVRFVIGPAVIPPFGDDDTPIARWESISTLDSAGREDESCFQKGYARAAMEQVLSIADKHGIVLAGKASAFGEKSTADDEVLTRFYSSLGFVPGRFGYMERKPQ